MSKMIELGVYEKVLSLLPFKLAMKIEKRSATMKDDIARWNDQLPRGDKRTKW